MSRLHYGPADGMARSVGEFLAGVAARCDEAGEVAAGDLAVRPPELVSRDARWRPAQRADDLLRLVEVAAEVQRRARR